MTTMASTTTTTVQSSPGASDSPDLKPKLKMHGKFHHTKLWGVPLKVGASSQRLFQSIQVGSDLPIQSLRAQKSHALLVLLLD